MPEPMVLTFKKNTSLAERVLLVKSIFPSNLHEIFDGMIENAYLTGRVDVLRELRTEREANSIQSAASVPEGPETP